MTAENVNDDSQEIRQHGQACECEGTRNDDGHLQAALQGKRPRSDSVTKRLRLSVTPYSGKDQRKQFQYQARLTLAKRIEDWINPQLTKVARTFTCFDIAEGIGADIEAVRNVLIESGRDYNGLTF